MSSPALAVPAPESLGLRLLRGAVALALALALTVLAALIVLGYVPAVRAAFAPLFDVGSKMPRVALTIAILFFICLPVLLLFWPLMRRLIRSGGAKNVR